MDWCRSIRVNINSHVARKVGDIMAREVTIWRPLRELIPFPEFERMRREMDRLWDSFSGRPRKRGEEEGEWLPSLDVSETKDEYVVKAEIPGIDPKDIDISLPMGCLPLKVRRSRKKRRRKRIITSSRSYGTFTRSIHSPEKYRQRRSKPSTRTAF